MIRFLQLLILGAVLLSSCGDSKGETTEEAPTPAPSPEVTPDGMEVSMNVGDTIRAKAIESQDSVKNGPLVITYPDGTKKAEGILKGGKKHSLWKSYYQNGALWSSTYFEDGLQDGYSITYFPDGRVQYKGEYKLGQKVGVWQFYKDDGTLAKEEDFGTGED